MAASRRGLHRMVCPKAVGLGRRGSGLPLDAKEWSISKKMATPLVTMEKARNGFLRRQEKKVLGTSRVSETGESLLLLEHSDLWNSPLELWNSRNTQPQSKGNVVSQEGEDYTEQALLLGVIE